MSNNSENLQVLIKAIDLAISRGAFNRQEIVIINNSLEAISPPLATVVEDEKQG